MPKMQEDQHLELISQDKQFLKSMFDATYKDTDGHISMDQLNGISAECADATFAERKLKNSDMQLCAASSTWTVSFTTSKHSCRAGPSCLLITQKKPCAHSCTSAWPTKTFLSRWARQSPSARTARLELFPETSFRSASLAARARSKPTSFAGLLSSNLDGLKGKTLYWETYYSSTILKAKLSRGKKFRGQME